MDLQRDRRAPGPADDRRRRSPRSSAAPTTSSTPRRDEPCTELWRALGDHRLPRDQRARGVRGRRRRASSSSRWSSRRPPRRAARCCCCSSRAAISAEVIGTLRDSRAAAGRGCPRLASARGEGRLRASPSPRRDRTVTSSPPRLGRVGDDWVISGTKYYISGVDEADAVLLVTRTGTDDRAARPSSRCSLVPTDTPGLVRTPLPVGVCSPRSSSSCTSTMSGCRVEALVGEEGDGIPQVFHGLNPERDHRRRAVRRRRPPRADPGRATTPHTRAVWDRPIGTHQGVSHPLAKAKIETELAALMTTQGRVVRTTAGCPAGEASPTWRSTPRPRRRSPPSTPRSRPTAATAWPSSTGCCPYWGLARLLRIAPVNREMVLNFVAQHSLGPARSY